MPGTHIAVRRVISAPADLVADFVTNPDNAPVWHTNVTAVEWHTARPATTGSRFDVVASILGRNVTYPIEIIEFVPQERLTIRSDQSRFPLEITYEFAQTPQGCEMTITNRGQPARLSRLNAALLSRTLRREAARDLGNLARLTEAMFGPFTP